MEKVVLFISDGLQTTPLLRNSMVHLRGLFYLYMKYLQKNKTVVDI